MQLAQLVKQVQLARQVQLGETGSTGTIGSTGTTGSTGETGITGTTGTTGSTGETGITGTTGSTGSAGSIGTESSNGDTGTTASTIEIIDKLPLKILREYLQTIEYNNSSIGLLNAIPYAPINYSSLVDCRGVKIPLDNIERRISDEDSDDPL